MFEKRVVRGNTYSSYIMSKEDEHLYKLNQKSSNKGPSRLVVDSNLQNVDFDYARLSSRPTAKQT